MNGLWKFACPSCRELCTDLGEGSLACIQCEESYLLSDGIWRFLPEDRKSLYRKFDEEYSSIRRREGRGSVSSDYYRALPFHDPGGRRIGELRIRSKSYSEFIRQILIPIERASSSPLKILDIGAGNGWLSYRLAQRKHLVAAIDILINQEDGLGAYIHYPCPFTPIQAEFDRLPLAGNQVDIVIFNASLHYSVRYEHTLEQSQRVLVPGGHMIIMDTPVYNDANSGQEMVAEQHQRFQRMYGYQSDSINSEYYLTYERLDDLSRALQLNWESIEPDYGMRWRLRPWLARLRGGREPARFLIISAKKGKNETDSQPVQADVTASA